MGIETAKLMAYRQCPRRLWLEVHHPELKQDSDTTQSSFSVGHQVGDVARWLYDPAKNGCLIDLSTLGFPAVFKETVTALQERRPIFEASFQMEGALVLADILLPIGSAKKSAWRMVEVKSSTSVKDVYRDDVAIQAHVAKSAGLNLAGVALAHIDSSWTYPGSDDYEGLLKEVDLTEEALARGDEVQGWIDAAQTVAAKRKEPDIKTGLHCAKPYECGFYGHCASLEPQAEMPIQWLPRFSSQFWIEQGVIELRDLPSDALNDIQKRVRDCTVSNEIYFDREGAQTDLFPYPLPGYFLDFETIQFAVPIWAGTRPYQQIPFQYSVHYLSDGGKLQHSEFLDLSGDDPSRPFAKQLVKDCGTEGPVFVYNAAFEKSRISELAVRFSDLAQRLLAINARIVDLLPVARNRYYHPAQKGSWSIKAVLPAAVPELSYEALEGVQNGGDAQEAFLEAIHPATTPEDRARLRQELLSYCGLDTFAMVRLWQVFAARTNWSL